MWDLISAVPCLSLKFPLVYVSNLALAVLSSSASRMVPRSANYLPMNNPGGTTCLCSHEALSFPLDYAKDSYTAFEHADVPLLASLFAGKLRVKESFSKSISIARWEAGLSSCVFVRICIMKICILACRFFLDQFQKAESPWNWTVDIKSWQDLIYFCKYSISLETPAPTSHPNQS